MDLEEWEILPDDGFLEIHEDGGKKIFSRKYGKNHQNSVFQMNYFICPSPNSPKFVEPTENSIVPKQIVHVPIQLDHDQLVKERTKVPIEIKIARSSSSLITEKIKDPNIIAVEAADQDAVSQVFFKKMKENEFVDMKMDSPKSGSSRGTMVPQIDATTFKFDDKSEGVESKKINLDSDIIEETTWEEENINSVGLNLWKWSLNGVGAICSFGVAAATICIIILGSSQKNKQIQQNQNLRFQIYTDDKRIKQMAHHATNLNGAISAARGVSLTRANVTFGGYYDGL